jgi:hypothetical protein
MPDWIRRRLGLEGPATLQVEGLPVETRPRLETLLHGVCEGCNGRWSNVEQKVAKWIGKSMRTPSTPFRLDPHQRQVTATWAVKTALMLELALSKHRQRSFAPVSQLNWLYNHSRYPVPPPGCRVWLFGTEVSVAPFYPTTTSATVLDHGPDVPDAYLATFTAGCVGFQVFGPDVVESPPVIDPPAQFQAKMKRIWPAEGSYRWPPAEHFMAKELFHVADWMHGESPHRPAWADLPDSFPIG